MSYLFPIKLQCNHWPESARVLGMVAITVLLALLPHLPHLPIWIPCLVIVALLWRLTLELRAVALPPRWLRIVMAITSMLLVVLNFHTLNGLEAGTALLTMMAGMKLLETRDSRDYTILIFIALFLLFAELLYDQSMLMLPYLLVSTLFSTATLLRLHDGGAHMAFSVALKRSTKMLMQALPLAVLLFLFFPRLPGQFWALPARGAASSGLSETMSPGDVSKLSLSDAVAFRVEFNGALPPAAQRYWRTIVLHDFDGRTWRRQRDAFMNRELPLPTIQVNGEIYDYRVLLEADNQRWIPVLDVPLQWNLPHSAMLPDLQLVTVDPISQLTAVKLRSATHYQFGEQLSPLNRRIDTRLASALNPRSRELAQRLRSETTDDASYIATVLRMFNQQHFVYTLEPPPLGANAVDDFLFTTRRGFCEHYASAFTVLMRAADIPARVVTGYQGGELNAQFNATGSYLIVRESDAHAWSEVWLDGRGWVRVDPTAAIAPQRIENNLQSFMAGNEPVPGRLLRQFKLLNSLRMNWDALNTYWKNRIVQFDSEQQQAVMKWLGFDNADWQTLGLSLVVAFVLFFFAMMIYLTWRFKPKQRDPAMSLYLVLQRKLAKRQIHCAPHEGPMDFLSRAVVIQPMYAMQLKEIRDVYVALRYGPHPDATQLQRLRELVSSL